MGRTVPTFTMSLERELSSWSQYRRALRAEDRRVFDQLFASARKHLAESAAAARPIPFEAMLLSMLLEQQKEIARLREALEKDGALSPCENQDLPPSPKQEDFFPEK